MTTISISGYGTFTIPTEKVQELLNWVSANSVRTSNENASNTVKFQGKDLIRG